MIRDPCSLSLSHGQFTRSQANRKAVLDINCNVTCIKSLYAIEILSRVADSLRLCQICQLEHEIKFEHLNLSTLRFGTLLNEEIDFSQGFSS